MSTVTEGKNHQEMQRSNKIKKIQKTCGKKRTLEKKKKHHGTKTRYLPNGKNQTENSESREIN